MSRRAEHKWVVHSGAMAVRLVGQDIGCNQAAVAVKVGSRFRR